MLKTIFFISSELSNDELLTFFNDQHLIAFSSLFFLSLKNTRPEKKKYSHFHNWYFWAFFLISFIKLHFQSKLLQGPEIRLCILHVSLIFPQLFRFMQIINPSLVTRRKHRTRISPSSLDRVAQTENKIRRHKQSPASEITASFIVLCWAKASLGVFDLSRINPCEKVCWGKLVSEEFLLVSSVRVPVLSYTLQYRPTFRSNHSGETVLGRSL